MLKSGRQQIAASILRQLQTQVAAEHTFDHEEEIQDGIVALYRHAIDLCYNLLAINALATSIVIADMPDTLRADIASDLEETTRQLDPQMREVLDTVIKLYPTLLENVENILEYVL